jgi:signal transduction histidine kinase
MGVAGWLARPFRPRRTVRLRMTLLYGGLFLLSGAALLTISSGLVVGSSAREATRSAAAVSQQPSQQSMLANDAHQIQQLQAALASATRSHSEISHQLLAASLIALAIMVAVSVLLGWFFAGRSLRPLRLITATARRISEDNLHERLALAGPADELKDLADTFDGLLERLEAAFAAQRRFVANASHELRTPLATMRASLDVAITKPGPLPAQTAVLAGRLRTELDRVDELLDGLLILARAQHGALPGGDLSGLDDLASAAIEARSAAISQAGLTVRRAGGCAAQIAGSAALLRRMLDNVVDNAIVYSQRPGWIAVGTWSGPGFARVVVENGGPVLEQAQVAQLGQPFRRLGADRTGSDRGSGLGLSIVAAIAAAHGGSVSLQARQSGGLQVEITLPTAPAGQARPGAPR